jgi:NAD dependent epimerase/dehydratase family enzyme
LSFYKLLIARPGLAGPVNLAAPNPVTNADLMRCFRAVCGRPLGLPAPRWLLECGAFCLRTETELILKSRRVVPARLLDSGFTFQFPELRPALEELAGRAA